MKIIDFFKLIRYKNLLIIILTQYLMRWFVIYPFLQTVNYDLQFSEFNFFLLVMATVCIAAAGYAINDYFDIKVDMENHPESVIVGNQIPRRTAMTINNVLNFIGVLFGFWISYKIGLYQLGFLFVLVSGGLWFYSALYKKQLIIGNLIVALFAALVPILTIVYEVPLLNKIITPDRPPIETTVVSTTVLFVAGYALFAFLTTFAREIIKDIEDIEGDKLNERKTIPAYWGIKASKGIIIALMVIIILALTFIYLKYFQDITSLFYIIIFIVLPTIYLIIKLLKAQLKPDYHFISKGLKGIMLAGLLFSILLMFIIE
jgi:4-hydroxybenzoate polyprenyltransferase